MARNCRDPAVPRGSGAKKEMILGWLSISVLCCERAHFTDSHSETPVTRTHPFVGIFMLKNPRWKKKAAVPAAEAHRGRLFVQLQIANPR